MTTTLHLSRTFALPLDAVTRRMAVLGMSGSGKSNVAVVLAEQMYAAGLPWVAIDPKGDWWGVRSSANGKNPGLPIPIFGGLHGDIPLEPTAGKLIADLIIDQRLTCVLDVSDFDTRQQMWGFLADFGTQLLRRNRSPLHLFLEEADEYLPQRTSDKGNAARCLGVWQRVVKRGRTPAGIGTTQITQRNAALNKDTLYMAEMLIAMRATGKGDRDAIKGWVEYAGASAEIVASLPTLDDGEGWASSPAWLKHTGRVHFNRRHTFDSGATPVLVAGGTPPATLADVDLAALSERMAATIERAKADDPAVLRAELARLGVALREARARPEAAPPDTRVLDALRAENDTLRSTAAAYRLTLEALRDQLGDAEASIGAVVASIGKIAAEALRGAPPTPVRQPAAVAPVPPSRAVRPVVPPAPAPRAQSPAPEPAEAVGRPGKAERAILTALAQSGPIPLARVALLAGYVEDGGGFRNAVGRCRTMGWINGGRGEDPRLTSAGLAVLGHYEPLPTGAAVLDYWCAHNRMLAPSRALLRLLADAAPRAVDCAAAAVTLGYAPDGGGWRNGVGRLRSLGLAEGPNSALRLSAALADAVA